MSAAEVEPVSPPPESDGDAALVDQARELIEGMTAPSQHAIDQHTAEEKKRETESPQPSAPTSGERDAAGEIFDPSKHATGRDGLGVRTANGTWRRRRGTASGAPRARVASVVGTPRRQGAPGISGGIDSETNAQARAAGVVAAHTLMNVACVIGGPEWAPIQMPDKGVDERRALEGAFGDYFVAKNWNDFPPGIALTVVVLGYALPRFTQPQTRAKVGKFKLWIATKIANWKARRARSKHDVPTPPPEKKPEAEADRFAPFVNPDG